MSLSKPNFAPLLKGLDKRVTKSNALHLYAGLTVVEANKLTEEEKSIIQKELLNEIELNEETCEFYT